VDHRETAKFNAQSIRLFHEPDKIAIRFSREKRMKPLTLACLTLLCFAGGCVNAGYDGKSALASHSKGTNIAGGAIAVINSTTTLGIPEHVTLKKIPWDASFGTSAIRIKIPGTRYAIPLVGGKVTPVIINEHPLEVWKIDGMRFTVSDHAPNMQASGQSITNANRIVPADRQLQLILDGGEIHEIWTLDFTDRKKGLQIRYHNGSGW
jgi:hypothetical protein